VPARRRAVAGPQRREGPRLRRRRRHARQRVEPAGGIGDPERALPDRVGDPPRATMAADANYSNIKVADLDPAKPLPEKVDVVWTSLNYHDMRARPNADLTPTNKMVFDALKPGGLYIVIDHAAEKGATNAGTLHRVDAELVKQDVTSVGFKLVQESDLLRNPADDRTKASSASGRGKSDQFVLLFQKPAG
jgi:predicted methyltransferase